MPKYDFASKFAAVRNALDAPSSDNSNDNSEPEKEKRAPRMLRNSGENKDTLIKSTKMGALVFVSFFVIITLMLAVSIFDKDRAISEKENRGLATLPKFSISALFDGKLIPDFEKYYSDQFPGRDMFLSVNENISKITSRFSAGGSDDVVIVSQESTEDDFGGEALHDKDGID